jgi:hypothetical protein
MKYATLGLLLLLGLVLAACEPLRDRYDSGRYDSGRYGPSASRDREGWELLGQTEADLRNDRDRIQVGRREGTFRTLRVVVRGAPLDMSEMVVTFGDGETFSPKLKQRFDENTTSREIDLPGNRRAIKTVDFNYRSVNRREGRATVYLYAR